LTWERGVLLIFDEVITGFRLGLGGAAAHFGFAPDLHCFGKAVGGGFPIGVFGGRRDVMEAVVTPIPGDPHAAETIFQSGTFSGAPPTMAAGLTMLRELEHTDAIAVADARAEAVRAGWLHVGGAHRGGRRPGARNLRESARGDRRLLKSVNRSRNGSGLTGFVAMS